MPRRAQGPRREHHGSRHEDVRARADALPAGGCARRQAVRVVPRRGQEVSRGTAQVQRLPRARRRASRQARARRAKAAIPRPRGRTRSSITPRPASRSRARTRRSSARLAIVIASSPARRAQCVQCHRANDKHAGKNGAECGACHAATAWADVSFDHGARSGFKLTGKHKQLACQSCHAAGVAAAVPRTCVGCHKADDRHAGKLGTSCADCHQTTRWSGTRLRSRGGDALRAARRTRAARVRRVSRARRRCAARPRLRELPLGARSAQGPTRRALRRLPRRRRVARIDPVRPRSRGVPAARQARGARLQGVPLVARFPRRAAARARTVTRTTIRTQDGSRARARPATTRPIGMLRASITTRPRTSRSRARIANLACDTCHRAADGGRALAAAARGGCVQCHRRDDPHGGRFGGDCGECHGTTSFAELKGR